MLVGTAKRLFTKGPAGPAGATAAAALTDVAAAIKAVLTAPDLATARAALGLGTAATYAPADLPVSNATQAAIGANVAAAINALLNGAPAALDTLKELADAINDDANFAATLTAALGLKAPLASPNLTGTPTAPTATAGTNTTQLATCAYVLAAVASGTNAAVTYVAQALADAQRIVARSNIGAAEAGNSADPNVLDNSAFDWWHRSLTPATALSCPAGTRTFLADRVWVSPAGAAVTQQQSTSVPTGSKSAYSLLVTGAASVTTVNIGLQRVPSVDIPRIKRVSTIQVALYNGTGAAFTSSLILTTPSSPDNFGTTGTAVLTQALQPCPAGQWTVVAYTGDLSALPNIANGLQVEVQIPSGVLVAGKTVNVAEMDLRAGAALMPFERRPRMADRLRCIPYARRKVLGAFAQAAGPGIAQFDFEPPMFATPSAGNLVVGSVSNAVVAAETAADQHGGFFQISASAAPGFILNRVNLYLAEIP